MLGLLLAPTALLAPGPALAQPHDIRIAAVFTTPDGAVQLIELRLEPAEHARVELRVTSSAHALEIAADLASPGEPALLLASPGYRELREAELRRFGSSDYPAPDFVLPADRFFDPHGDTLAVVVDGVSDALVFPAFPSDGFTSLVVPERTGEASAAAEPSVFPRAPLSPTNRAGEAFQDRDLDGRADRSDNCPDVLNSGQSDVGGLATPETPQGNVPDGVGDACQCGDVNDDGRVTAADSTLITRATLGLAPFPSVELLPGFDKCDVADPTLGECTVADATSVLRAVRGLPGGFDGGLCRAARPRLPLK